MLETKIKKININALLKGHEEKTNIPMLIPEEDKESISLETEKISTNEISQDTKKDGKVKISINSIKSTKKDFSDENEKTIPAIDTKELKPMLINQENKKINENKEKNLSIDSKKSDISTKESNSDNHLEDEEKIPVLVDKKNKDLFSNYQSDFKIKSKSILERLKKVQKTRITLVAGLIILTVSSISGLFYIDPDTHSINNYKTSILNMVGKKVKIETQEKSKSDESHIINEEILIRKEEIIEVTKIDLGGSIIKIEKIKLSGEIKYKFEGSIFDNKELLNIEVEKFINKRKELKIKNFILKKYLTN